MNLIFPAGLGACKDFNDSTKKDRGTRMTQLQAKLLYWETDIVCVL
jgi:hypothetical protein